MASGSLYETSPTVSGWNVNRSITPPSPYPSDLPSFTPYLYVATGPKAITDANFGLQPLGTAGTDPLYKNVVKVKVSDIPLPAGDPARPAQTTLGPRTQVTASPLMVVDATGTGNNKALFLLYDPDSGCNGTSYITIINFISSKACDPPAIVADPDKIPLGATSGIDTTNAGAGAASGITLTDKGLFAAKSGLGRNSSANLQEIPLEVPLKAGVPQFLPVWWRDVK